LNVPFNRGHMDFVIIFVLCFTSVNNVARIEVAKRRAVGTKRIALLNGSSEQKNDPYDPKDCRDHFLAMLHICQKCRQNRVYRFPHPHNASRCGGYSRWTPSASFFEKLIC
jgi:hypothetical protein